jgi:MFS family permease
LSKHPSLLPEPEGRQALAVLLLFSNLLNYLDRQLFLSLFPLFRTRFDLSDQMLGVLASSFTLVYILVAPFSGALLQMASAGKLLAGGIFTFSAGMAITGFTPDLAGLFLGRMLTGAGEAVLTTIGPVLLMESPISGIRGKGMNLGIFYSAIPVGSALGFALGGLFSHQTDFQRALLLPVLPGFLLSWLIYTAFQKSAIPVLSEPLRMSLWKGILQKPVLLSFFVQAAVTFVLGGMAAWLSIYLTRVKLMDLAGADMASGLALLGGGLTGILAGGRLLDQECHYRPDAWGFRTTLAGLLAAGAGVLLVLATRSHVYLMPELWLATFGLFLGMVPVNCLILKRNPPALSTPLMGWCLLFTHVFGDLPSPSLIGWVSERFSLEEALSFCLLVPISGAILAVCLYRRI